EEAAAECEVQVAPLCRRASSCLQPRADSTTGARHVAATQVDLSDRELVIERDARKIAQESCGVVRGVGCGDGFSECGDRTRRVAAQEAEPADGRECGCLCRATGRCSNRLCFLDGVGERAGLLERADACEATIAGDECGTGRIEAARDLRS